MTEILLLQVKRARHEREAEKAQRDEMDEIEQRGKVPISYNLLTF